MSVSVGFDRQRAKQFSARMVEMLNAAAVIQMISVGNRTGLFDAMAAMDRGTSSDIAAAASLDERYVREWLGSVTTGGVVEYDPADRTYRLPSEHAASLTTAAGPANLSVLAKTVASTGQVEAQIVECFRHGGGVPYSEYPEFHLLQRELSGAVQDTLLIRAVLPLIDGLVERLHAGVDVADVGCGAGHAVNLMAAAFPASRFVGFDFSDEAVAMGRAEADAVGLTNATFEQRDAAHLDADGEFDFITAFDSIHDQAHPREVVAAIARALRHDGTWLCVDVAGSSNLEDNREQPLAPLFYAVSTMHCMTVSLAYGGEGLGSMWGEQQATQIFTAAGFGKVDVRKLPGDIVNNYYICRK